MKIDNFFIRKYGPLEKRGEFELSQFTLFYGDNETGKSLTIDALVKMILGEKAGSFKKINRVDHRPEGYVFLKTKDKRIKLPEKGSLLDFLPVTAEECENIFVIRDSELGIGEESQEKGFYKKVTDKLTGLKTGEIESVQEELRELSHLTPHNQLKNTKENNYLKNRVEKTKQLIKKISDLKKSFRKRKFSKQLEDLQSLKERIKREEKKLKDLKVKKQWEVFGKAKDLLEEVKSKRSELENLKSFNSKRKDEWLKKEIKKESLEKEIEKQEKKIKLLEKNLDELKIKKREEKTRKTKLAEKMEKAERDITPLLSQSKWDRLFTFLNRKNNVFGVLGLILVLGSFGLFFTGDMFYPAVVMTVFSFFWLAAILAGGLRREIKRGKLEKELEKIGWEEKARENLKRKIKKIRERLEKTEERCVNLGQDLEIKKRETKEKKRVEKELKSNLKKIQSEIERFKKEAGVEGLKEYRDFLQKRIKKIEKIKESTAVLKNIVPGIKTGEDISSWENMIKNLKPKEEKRGKESEEKMEKVESRLEKLKDERREKEQGLKKNKKRMDQLKRSVNEVLPSQKKMAYLETVSDLKEAEDKLKSFERRVEKRKQNAVRALETFEKLKEKEEEKISHLFEEENNISKYFKKITSGRYQKVFFDQKKNKIKVERADGEVLGAEKLSGGTYDQLYFVIRFSLGEKILGSEKGFFILDDPFVKADDRRLKKGFEMLYNFTNWGWQIIYFTAKKDALGALDKRKKETKIIKLSTLKINQ